MTATPPKLAELEVMVPAEHVIGFPLHCALTVRCDRAGASLFVPHVDVLDDGGVVGFSLEDPSGNVLAANPRGTSIDEDQVELVTLHANEARRMLVDLSAAFVDDLPEGAHGIRIRYAAPIGVTTSAPQPIRVRAPTAAERAMLDGLDPPRPAGTTWGRWIMTPPPVGALFHPNVARFLAQPLLRLAWLLRSILHGDGPEVWDRGTIEALDGALAPEREALWAELLSLRGDPDLPQQIARVRADHPALEWWMRSIEEGTSNVAAMRAAFSGMRDQA